MGKLFSLYNQNKNLFWLIVITIVAVIVLLHVLNGYVAKSDSERNKDNTIVNSITNYEENKNNPVVEGEKLNETVGNTIDEFITFCNEGKPEEPYNLLSDECKEQLYPTLKDFTNNYYNRIFKETKVYSYQAWTTYKNKSTYRINFTEDSLATRKSIKNKYCRLLHSYK